MKHILLILIAVHLLACNKEDETLTGSLAGKVKIYNVIDLTGIKAEIENQGHKKVSYTDSEGMFFFDDLGRDYYTVTVSKEGYHTQQIKVIILGNGKPNIIEIELQADGSLN
jgi:hypothetical protein